MSRPSPAAVARRLAALLALSTAACATDDVTAPLPPVAGTLTVDASAGWAYVDLASGAVVTPGATPGSSAAWDVALFATNVMLNGGAAGPAGVTGACLCQNAGASDEAVLAMTAESERADFDAVTAVPAGVAFTEEQLVPAVGGWFTGSGASAAADPGRTFLVRLADGAAFAKLRVTALQTPTADAAGRVTLEYAVQPAADAPFGPTQTADVTVSATADTRLDLNPAAGVSPDAGWDLALRGFTIRTNGGVSGAGQGAATTTAATFAAATAAGLDARAFRADVFSGVFAANRYYRYNIGGDNRISPTFDVYLIRRGSTVYKLQIVDYYGDTGAPRQITFRYEQIAG